MKIKDLFNGNDYYIMISLTENFSVYIECLDEDYIPITNNFNFDKVKHFFIELNDNKGEYYEPIQNYFNEEITLDTTIEDFKNKIIELALQKMLDFIR